MFCIPCAYCACLTTIAGELDDDSDGDSGSSGDLMDDSDGDSDLPINGTVDSHDSDSDNEADNSESESERMSEEGESESESDQSHSDDHSDHSIDSDADTDSDGEPGGSTKAKGANGAMANGHKAPNAKQQAAAKQPPAPAAQKGKGAAPAAAAAQQRAAANGVANGASHRGNGAGAGEGGDTDSEGVGGGYEDEATRRQQKGASTSGQGTRAAGAQQGGTGGFFAQAPDGTTFKAASFGDLNLSRPLTRACHALGYTTPTPIQVRRHMCTCMLGAARPICMRTVGLSATYMHAVRAHGGLFMRMCMCMGLVHAYGTCSAWERMGLAAHENAWGLVHGVCVCMEPSYEWRTVLHDV